MQARPNQPAPKGEGDGQAGSDHCGSTSRRFGEEAGRPPDRLRQSTMHNILYLGLAIILSQNSLNTLLSSGFHRCVRP